jgi:4-amino-4-deoxy-L-arabinose transferase-like glycosyltransferase
MIRKVAFTFIILGLLFRAYQMRHVAFYDWDEGFYAEVAQEILHFKSLQARFNGDIWLDKPALSHYQFATIFAVTKEQDHELYARMLMVGYAVIMLGFTYLLNRRLVNHFFSKEIQTFSTKGREFVYLIPVLVTASTPLFLERSTQLNTDTILSVAWLGYLLTLSIYARMGELFYS